MFKKKKSPLKSPKILKRKRRVRLFKISGAIFSILFIIGATIYIARLHVLAITSIQVEGNSAVDSEGLQERAQTYLTGAYVGIFPTSNRFLYPKSAIKKDLLTHNKRLQSVDLDVEGHDLIIHVVERTPTYTWCTGTPQTADKSCYFMDTNGYIFSQSPVFSGNAFLAFYGLIDNADPIGTSYLNSSSLKDVSVLTTFLANHNIRPYALIAEANGVSNLYLEDGGKLIFKQGQPMSLLVANIDLILKNTDLFSKSAATLEYVDLRFGNKLYYKRIGDNMLQIGN
jgi:cell division septal protein FtsQ